MNFIGGQIETPQSISVPTPEGKKVLKFAGEVDQKYVGRDIAVGVRPQQIKVAKTEKEGASIPGSVKVIEFQGEMTVLTMNLGDGSNNEVKAVVPATEKYNTDETVWLHLDPEVIHIFHEEISILQRKGK